MPALLAVLTSDVPRLVALSVVVLATVVTIAVYRWRERHSYAHHNRAHTPEPVRGIVYRDAPTIRVVDSQRIDRVRKLVRLSPGEHIDVLEDVPAAAQFGASPRFRIALKRVVRMDDGTALAHIAVDFGGTAVSCGPLVEEIGFNEFVLPRASRNEPRNCVFHYQENGDSLDFMRIKLRGLDENEDIAEIDVWQVSGHWPRG